MEYSAKIQELMTAKGNNSLGSFDLYKERLFYKSGAYPLYGPKALDLWYNVPLYGKIDHGGNFVFWSERYADTLTNDDKVIIAIDFVAAAFEDFRKHYRNSGILNRRHSRSTDSLFQLKPVKAHASLHRLHRRHFQILHDLFSTSFLKDKKRDHRMASFHDYIKLFVEAADLVLPHFPITKTAFLSSKLCTNNVSGLVVEISDARSGDDYIKHKKYINNGNFNMYRNFARKHGFLVDKNAPWRMIADISTEEMKKYMYNSGVDTSDLFDKYYEKTHHHDIDSLKVELYEFYREYVEAYPTYQKVTPTVHSTKTCNFKREKISRIQFEKEYDMNFWLKFYLYIRTKEEQINMGQTQFEAKVRRAQKLFQYKSLTHALDYINMEVRRFTERVEGEGLKPGGHRFIF